ncbi:MAG: ABC transporter substrate-binding protein [Oscillospiraceae bacterium]|nr:ABC transporter substrate-binding protein [Oscillospiraceae bacterium]
MKKFIIILIITLFLCSCSNNSKANINITAIKGPTGMGMVKVMENSGYNFTIASAPDEITAEIIKGTVDIAAVPINLAAVLYARTDGDIQIAAINTLGVLYILENGNSIKSIADLSGKTIYATAQGSTPEYILRYLLKQNNIDAEIVFYSEHSELAALMVAGEVSVGMLPEPNVTTVLNQNENIRIALDLTAEWTGTLVQGCIVVRKEFAENNKATLDKFLDEYKKSVDFVNNNPKEASVLIEKYEIIPKAAIAEKAIPNCNICYIDGDEMKKSALEMYSILFEANPASIGGKIPDEEFFYQK